MKPITEYGFRQITGRFVILEAENPHIIDPGYDLFVAYGYIDMEAGISFRIYGGYKDENIDPFQTKSITIRYSPDIRLDLRLDLYDSLTEEMREFARNIEEIYTPDWIIPIRKNTEIDKVRSEQFPDDMLIPAQTINDGKRVGEYLWFRPTETVDNYLVAESLEDGKYISMGEEVAVFVVSGKDEYSVIATTNDWLEWFNNNHN